MSEKPEDDRVPAAPPDEQSPAAGAETGSGLPRPVQEHLGHQLRTTYNALAEKPAFLGDPAVPPHLDHHLQRLETREKIRGQGIEAVADALQDLDLQDLGLNDETALKGPKGGPK